MKLTKSIYTATLALRAKHVKAITQKKLICKIIFNSNKNGVKLDPFDNRTQYSKRDVWLLDTLFTYLCFVLILTNNLLLKGCQFKVYGLRIYFVDK
ncbi:hypothetical protein QTP88_004420 [Uroleucon formosanum]